MKKIIANIAMLAMLIMPLSLALPAAAAPTPPNWNVTGSYVMGLNYQSTVYPHDMVLAEDSLGNLTGNGGSPAGANTYTWVITSGAVSGNTINFLANYTATPDAVTPLTVFNVTGTIAPDGTMSGTWSDNYQGGSRAGTWSTTSGNAASLSSLAAQDFGVMNQSGVKGYTAGFGFSDATISDAQSITVSLYSGAALLQTNTAMPAVFALPGTDFSSPFDVFGTFNYATDGYWTNVRSAEYGQTLIPTSVVATATLSNGKVVTATNSNLTGDPTTIFPVAPTNVTVTIEKYIDGVQATATNANNQAFPMTETYTINSVTASSTYTLSPSGINSSNAYEAVTSPLDLNSNYSTNEVTGGTLVGTTCNTNQPFALIGYTSGSTLALAQAATPSATMPAFTGMTGNMFVIVWNQDCSKSSGNIGGTVTGGNSALGILAVTSITPVSTSATADNTFADGWSYIFHVTVPTNEPNLAMKFANWTDVVDSVTMPTANNMEISSAQADNAGAEVPITAANVYSAPSLHLTSDLDPATPGLQVNVLVNVKIPLNSVNGVYSTSYGVQTNP